MASEELPAKWTQAYPPADTNPPTKAAEILDKALGIFTARHVKCENQIDIQRKMKVLQDLNKIHNEWVRECAFQVEGIKDVNGQPIVGRMETSGSWRLGIYEKDSDIDLVCIAPRFCTYDLFFGLLADKLTSDRRVTQFRPISGAFVPIMSFLFDSVDIDLLLVTLPHASTVPKDLDILNDELLNGMSEQSRRSFNGPRDTMVISQLIRSAGSRLRNPPEAKDREQNFLKAIRCVRHWAKKRYIYSNKMGYLGGINFNILVTMVVQYFPNQSAGQLFLNFFRLYASVDKDPSPEEENPAKRGVRWYNPVRLCKEQTGVNGSLDQEVYPNSTRGAVKGDMPIVTPSYPAYNSAGSVNTWSLGIMNEEFARAAGIATEIEQLAEEEASANRSSNHSHMDKIAALLEKLVEPSDFFWRPDYKHFLAVSIKHTVTDEASEATAQYFDDFKSITESMFRNIAVNTYWKNLGDFPLTRIHILSKPFDAEKIYAAGPPPAAESSIGDSDLDVMKQEEASGDNKSSSSVSSASSSEEYPKEATFWVAFVPDSHRYHDDIVQAGQLVRDLEGFVKQRFEKDNPGRAAGMSMTPMHCKQKELPDYVFDMGDYGKERAMLLRAERKQLKIDKRKQREEEQKKSQVEAAQANDDDKVEKAIDEQPQMGEQLEEAATAAATVAAAHDSALVAAAKPLWRAVVEAHRSLPILGKTGDVAVNLSIAAPPLRYGALKLALQTSAIAETIESKKRASSFEVVTNPALPKELAPLSVGRINGPFPKRIRGVALLEDED